MTYKLESIAQLNGFFNKYFLIVEEETPDTPFPLCSNKFNLEFKHRRPELITDIFV